MTARLAAMLVACAPLALFAQNTPVNANRPQGTIVASNMNDNTVTLIDANSLRTIATLPTGEGPHEVAISHNGRWALVSNYGVRGKPGNSISVVDVTAAKIAGTIVLDSLQRPHGMSFLRGDTTFLVTSEAKQLLAVVRFPTGGIVGTVPSKGRVTHMLAVPASGNMVFTANIADNTVSAIDLSGRDSTRTFAVARSPEGIAVAPDGNTVWAGSNRDSVVLVVDAKTGNTLDRLAGFGMPYRIAISSDNATAVITDPSRGEVRIYSARTRALRSTVTITRDSLVATAEVPGSPSPEGVAITPDSKFALVTLQGKNRVVILNLEHGTIVGSAPTGVWSDGVGFSAIAQPRRN